MQGAGHSSYGGGASSRAAAPAGWRCACLLDRPEQRLATSGRGRGFVTPLGPPPCCAAAPLSLAAGAAGEMTAHLRVRAGGCAPPRPVPPPRFAPPPLLPSCCRRRPCRRRPCRRRHCHRRLLLLRSGPRPWPPPHPPPPPTPRPPPPLPPLLARLRRIGGRRRPPPHSRPHRPPLPPRQWWRRAEKQAQADRKCVYRKFEAAQVRARVRPWSMPTCVLRAPLLRWCSFPPLLWQPLHCLKRMLLRPPPAAQHAR